METITFYSYKGGVGRSLLLANTALFLANESKSVFLIDLDLEAPGLHHKFNIQSNHPGLEKGLVSLLSAASTTDWAASDSLHVEEFQFQVRGAPGDIRLMPAGNPPSPMYPLQLWEAQGHFSSDAGLGSANLATYLIKIKEEIEKVYNPDYLLLDSRTGISYIGGVALNCLSDKVVVLTNQTSESKEGCRATIRGIKRAALEDRSIPPQIIPILTRVPYERSRPERDRLSSQVTSYFLSEPEANEQQTRLVPSDLCETLTLHSQPDLQKQEVLVIDGKAALRRSVLLQEYLKFFSVLCPSILRTSHWEEFHSFLGQDDVSAHLDYEHPARSEARMERSASEVLLSKNASPLRVASATSRIGDSISKYLQTAVLDHISALKQGKGDVLMLAPNFGSSFGKEAYSPDRLADLIDRGGVHFYPALFSVSSQSSRFLDLIELGELQYYYLLTSRTLTAKSRFKRWFSPSIPLAHAAVEHGADKTFVRECLEDLKVSASSSNKKLVAGVVIDSPSASDMIQHLMGACHTVDALANERALVRWIEEHLLRDDVEIVVPIDFSAIDWFLQKDSAQFDAVKIAVQERIPVGVCHRRGDHAWRQVLSRAILETINPELWGSAFEDLEVRGVGLESLDSLKLYLALELPPKEALETVKAFQRRTPRRVKASSKERQ